MYMYLVCYLSVLSTFLSLFISHPPLLLPLKRKWIIKNVENEVFSSGIFLIHNFIAPLIIIAVDCIRRCSQIALHVQSSALDSASVKTLNNRFIMTRLD